MPDNKPRITVIWTRDISAESVNGRMGILKNIQALLHESGTLIEIRQLTLIERFGKFLGSLFLINSIVGNGFLGRMLPLQCALFGASRKLAQEVLATAPDIVVLDSIRQISLLYHLRRAEPNLPILLDMDDLMSRRFALLIENGFYPSLGEFRKKVPVFFAKLLTSQSIAKLVMSYEKKALERVELLAVSLATKVVMVSQYEAQVLRSQYEKKSTDAVRARSDCIFSIAPPVRIPEEVVAFDPKGRNLRFAFIGSDSVVQNATAIDELLSIWNSERPSQELVLFGKLTRTYIELPPQVTLYGLVESIGTVYDGRTVLLTPTRLGGGVKTKFLEAFAYGAPVIGSKLTYEGVPDAAAYLKLEDLQSLGDLFNEERLVPLLIDAASQGQAIVTSQYSSRVYQSKWSALIFDVLANDLPLNVHPAAT